MQVIEKVTSGWSRANLCNQKILLPENINELVEIIRRNNEKNEKYTIRGGGQSYFDMATSQHNKLICLKKLNNIIELNKIEKTITVESGVTVIGLINYLKEKNYIVSSLPGTVHATIGGIISNNSHGKDTKYGNFSDRVISLKVLLTDGNILNVTKGEKLFNYIIGHAGLICIILEAKIKLIEGYSYSNLINKKIVIFNNINDGIELINNAKDDEYSGIWIDAFSKNYRGLFINGKWSNKKRIVQDISEVGKQYYIINFFFKIYHFFSRIFICNFIVRLINNFLFIYTKFFVKKNQLVDFNSFYFYHNNNFINIRKMFPKGIFEIQLLVKKENKNQLLEIFKLCKKYQLESWVCGTKKHKKDNFPNSFSINGYDLTINFPYKKTKSKTFNLFYNELKKYVLKNDIIFHLAKDSILDKNTFNIMYPNFKELIKLKKELDKKLILTSDFYNRLIG